MIFSNNYKRSSNSYNKSQTAMQQSAMQQQLVRQPRVMPIQIYNYTPIPIAVRRPEPELPVVKLKWGRPIWTFFHVMAQKMKEEYFTNIIGGFMQMITSICSVLPCPVCSKHAMEYINSVNVNNIRTKQDLINFFYTFHNVVNKRKNYPTFSREAVISTYENANIYYVIKEFMFHFEDKHKSSKLIVDDFMRRRVVPQVKSWINSNIQYFNP
jgi:hypothetical protein